MNKENIMTINQSQRRPADGRDWGPWRLDVDRRMLCAHVDGRMYHFDLARYAVSASSLLAEIFETAAVTRMRGEAEVVGGLVHALTYILKSETAERVCGVSCDWPEPEDIRNCIRSVGE